jgi:hypothetical protein
MKCPTMITTELQINIHTTVTGCRKGGEGRVPLDRFLWGRDFGRSSPFWFRFGALCAFDCDSIVSARMSGWSTVWFFDLAMEWWCAGESGGWVVMWLVFLAFRVGLKLVFKGRGKVDGPTDLNYLTAETKYIRNIGDPDQLIGMGGHYFFFLPWSGRRTTEILTLLAVFWIWLQNSGIGALQLMRYMSEFFQWRMRDLYKWWLVLTWLEQQSFSRTARTANDACIGVCTTCELRSITIDRDTLIYIELSTIQHILSHV